MTREPNTRSIKHHKDQTTRVFPRVHFKSVSVTYKMKSNPLATSTLPVTILKTNPGVDKATETNLLVASRLARKTNKATDYRRKLFCTNFEFRQNRRKKLYNRLKPKLSSSSRNAIEKYKVEVSPVLHNQCTKHVAMR